MSQQVWPPASCAKGRKLITRVVIGMGYRIGPLDQYEMWVGGGRLKDDQHQRGE